MNWRKPIIIAALWAKGDKTLEKLDFIKKLDKKSDKEKQDYQNDKLEKILLHAYNHVPYYHDILAEARVVINNKVFLENFSKIPVLTKAIIRKEGDRLYSDDRASRHPYKNTSGGSTGEPVEFLQDKEYGEWNIANKIFYKTFSGQDLGDRELRLWGSERDILLGKEKPSIRFRNFLYNRREFNTFRMAEADMARYASEWNAFRPQWVEAYVQSIYEFARYAAAKGIKMHSPRGVLTTSGTIYPAVAETVRSVFGCSVYNRYGSREVGDMACSDGSGHGMRLSIWNQRLEVQPEGQICVTTLNNYSMPLIRYNIGDLGVSGSDPLYLQSVTGRDNCLLKTATGTLDSTALTTSFYHLDSIVRYQMVQESLDKFSVAVVVSDATQWERDREVLVDKLRRILGEAPIVTVTVVDSLPDTPSGKFQYIVSKV